MVQGETDTGKGPYQDQADDVTQQNAIEHAFCGREGTANDRF